MSFEEFSLEVASYADIGGREEQQDRTVVLRSEDACLLALADGMGGHEGGALAAQKVVDATAACFQTSGASTPEELLTNIVNRAHSGINALGAKMGISPHSTCVLLHVTDAAATWAHVGDSRLYRFEHGHFVERTVDHSIIELKRLRGRITEREMQGHPDQNRLYEALGGEEPPQPDIGSKQAAIGDGFLLVSDGIWAQVTGEQMQAVFDAASLVPALERLTNQAKDRGGLEGDNLSIVACRRTYAQTAPISKSIRD